MRVINKRPEYIKNSDRIKKLNQAYTFVFRTINKIDLDQEIHMTQKKKSNN